MLVADELGLLTSTASLTHTRHSKLVGRDVATEFPDLSRFAVMQHLGVLETADLVVARKRGRQRFNQLNPVPIQQISDRWISRYHRPLAEALIDLKFSLESETSVAEPQTKTEQTAKEAST